MKTISFIQMPRYFLMSSIFLITHISCTFKENKTDPYRSLLSENDIKLPEPKPGEWLYTHVESGQTLEQYQNSSPVTANDKQHIIYLQPIGDFDSIQFNLISSSATYLKIFFNLETRILPTLPAAIFPTTAKRMVGDKHEQVSANFILYEVLKKRMPLDAVGIMAITAIDLYPELNLNYVFGLSSYQDRVSVTSIYRFSINGSYNDPNNVSLNRLIKIASHEIGHMFSLKHCTRAICLMNGMNSLQETDAKPNRLCSECFAKLNWNLHFDPIKRWTELNDFFYSKNMETDLMCNRKDSILLEKKIY